jgi:hypothetical protein
MLTLRVIDNMVNKHTVRPSEEREWNGYSLSRLAPDGATGCVVNGCRIEKERWGFYVPADGDFVTFMMTDRDPSMVLTVMSLGILGANLYFPTVWAKNLLFPEMPPIPGPAEAGKKVFGFNEVNNVGEGFPVPLPYGKIAFKPHIVGSWTEAIPSQDPTQGKNKLAVLLCLGEGPIHAVGEYTTDQDELTSADGNLPDGLKINDRDASTYENVTCSLRLGSQIQTVMPGCEEVVMGYNSLHQLDEADTWEWKTKSPIQGADVNIRFPKGLRSFEMKTGQLAYLWAEVTVELWSADGTTKLATIVEYIRKKVMDSPYYHTVRLRHLDDGSVIPLDRYIIRAYRSFNHPTFTSGDAGNANNLPWYKSGDTRRQDLMQVFGVNERIAAPIAYRRRAMMLLSMEASQELEGAFPVIEVKVDGRKVRNVETSVVEFSRSPANIAADFATASYSLGRFFDTSYIGSTFTDWQDFCAETVPLYTGSEDTEERAVFDGVFLERVPAWVALQRIAGAGRASIIPFGNELVVKINRERGPVDLFNVATMEDVVVRYEDPNERPNEIRASFINREKDFRPDEIRSNDRDGSATTETKAPGDLDLFGVTRPTQAARELSLSMRANKRLLKGVSFVTSIRGVTAEVGDVVRVQEELPELSWGGLLEGAAAGSITLDRQITFLPGKVYRYLEKKLEADDSESVLSQDFSVSSETTTSTLSFAPLHGTTNAIGRPYSISIRGFEPMRAEIVSSELVEDFKVRLDCIQYEPTVPTDETDPRESNFAQLTPATPPDAVTDLAAVETFERRGVSRISVSWTSSVGAVRFDVYVRIHTASAAAWELAGRTRDSALAFTVAAEFGIGLTIAVVAVAADGAQRTIQNSAQVSLTILRDDTTETVGEIPGNVTGASVALLSGNTYRLSWDAVPDVDGYEVRLNAWTDGAVLASTTDTYFDFQTNRRTQLLMVRAKKDRFYSRCIAAAATPEVAWPGFVNQGIGFSADFDEGDIQNGNKVRNEFASFFQALLQLDNSHQMRYTTKVYDTGAKRAYFVSLDARVMPWPLAPLSTIFLANPNFSIQGPINESVIDWDVSMLYSDDDESWTERVLPKDYFANPIFQEARYFRFRVRASVKEIDGRRDYLACLKRLAFRTDYQ